MIVLITVAAFWLVATLVILGAAANPARVADHVLGPAPLDLTQSTNPGYAQALQILPNPAV